MCPFGQGRTAVVNYSEIAMLKSYIEVENEHSAQVVRESDLPTQLGIPVIYRSLHTYHPNLKKFMIC